MSEQTVTRECHTGQAQIGYEVKREILTRYPVEAVWRRSYGMRSCDRTSRESGQAGIPGHESLLFIAAPVLARMTFHFYDISLLGPMTFGLFSAPKPVCSMPFIP